MGCILGEVEVGCGVQLDLEFEKDQVWVGRTFR